MLMGDLDAMLCANENLRTTELVLFEGVLRQCQLCTRGSHTVSDATGSQFNNRVRTLCALVIVMLQHRGDRRSFLSINAPSSAVAGNSVSNQLLRALIGVVRDSALLYCKAPRNKRSPGAATAPPAAVRSPLPATTAAYARASASLSSSVPSHVSVLSDSSSEDDDEEKLLARPAWHATRTPVIDLVGDD